MPRSPRSPGDRWDCEACGEPLVGALTINKKVAPIELAIADAGNVWLGRSKSGEVICATLGGPLLEKAREVGIALHLNHFAYCPQRERFARS